MFCRVFIVASKHRGHFSRVRNIVEVIPVSGYPCVRNGGSISLTRDNRLRVQSPSRTNIEAPEKNHGTRERVFFEIVSYRADIDATPNERKHHQPSCRTYALDASEKSRYHSTLLTVPSAPSTLAA